MKYFEDLFNVVLLLQCGLTACMMCVNLYAFQLLSSIQEFGYIGTLGVLVILEPMLLCWTCHTLTVELTSLLITLYDLDWLNYPPSLRRKITFMMMVFTKPKTLTLGGWTQINMAFCLAWIKNSYSAYTLISETQNK
ncbi:putative odorant receptor 19b [Aethina tumida]|uniref:putative odorant receptor 19b n=1 Tax=Aethina tumida TaxID=116153 RepID=UPI0021485825|nr:putative odorant receptor 19b [Aethina tumida]